MVKKKKKKKKLGNILRTRPHLQTFQYIKSDHEQVKEKQFAVHLRSWNLSDS